MAEKQKRKKWKIFLVAFVAVLVLAVGGLYTFQLVVDPFGIWGGPEIAGFNNFKSVQDKNERMWKIYEYYRMAPDVAFFGSSRINYCTPAEWPGVDDDKVFNFGLNAAHIPEESYYFKGALEAHQPTEAAEGDQQVGAPVVVPLPGEVGHRRPEQQVGRPLARELEPDRLAVVQRRAQHR